MCCLKLKLRVEIGAGCGCGTELSTDYRIEQWVHVWDKAFKRGFLLVAEDLVFLSSSDNLFRFGTNY